MNADRRRKVAVIGLVLCVIYVSSYLALSRRGFAQADEWNARGFYFITLSSHKAWQVNWCLVIVYYNEPWRVSGEGLWDGTPSKPPSTLPEGSFLAFDPPGGRVKSIACKHV